MPLTPTERSVVSDAEKASLVYLSLHTADPGTTGASEATGGSPAYARKVLTWGSSASGVVSAGQVAFDVPTGTYTHFGFWSAATGGTFKGGNALASSQSPSGQAIIQVTPTLTVTAS